MFNASRIQVDCHGNVFIYLWPFRFYSDSDVRLTFIGLGSRIIWLDNISESYD